MWTTACAEATQSRLLRVESTLRRRACSKFENGMLAHTLSTFRMHIHVLHLRAMFHLKLLWTAQVCSAAGCAVSARRPASKSKATWRAWAWQC